MQEVSLVWGKNIITKTENLGLPLSTVLLPNNIRHVEEVILTRQDLREREKKSKKSNHFGKDMFICTQTCKWKTGYQSNKYCTDFIFYLVTFFFITTHFFIVTQVKLDPVK